MRPSEPSESIRPQGGLPSCHSSQLTLTMLDITPLYPGLPWPDITVRFEGAHTILAARGEFLSNSIELRSGPYWVALWGPLVPAGCWRKTPSLVVRRKLPIPAAPGVRQFEEMHRLTQAGVLLVQTDETCQLNFLLEDHNGQPGDFTLAVGPASEHGFRFEAKKVTLT